MAQLQFGWRKDKYDGRDYLHKTKVAPVPDTVVLREYLTDVRKSSGADSATRSGIRS